MATVRTPAVAGTFYPSRPAELDAAVQFYLSQVEGVSAVPKAIIAPHAGFVYSGPVAASAYARIRPARDRIRRVVLIGPCHRVAVNGVALPTVAVPCGSANGSPRSSARLASTRSSAATTAAPASTQMRDTM